MNLSSLFANLNNSNTSNVEIKTVEDKKHFQ